MVLQDSQKSVSREEFGTVKKTIPLFCGSIPEGELVEILERYVDGSGCELLTIRGKSFVCNGVVAESVVVKPVGLPF